MTTSWPELHVISFGVFELDLQAGELRKGGVKVKLQEQPFQVLLLLLENPGKIVTREELVKKLWPDGTFVEFDRSLNIAVNKIRDALDDSANAPRFVETVPRRGYRFIAPVKREARQDPDERLHRWPPLLAGVVALAALGTTVAFLWPRPSAAPLTFSEVRLTSAPGFESNPSFSPDGNWVAYEADGDISITLAEVGSGPPIRVTNSPGRDKDPAWSPDGKQIVFARIVETQPGWGGTTFQLILVPPVENAPERDLTGKTFTSRSASIGPSWSPDGNYIAFSCRHGESASQHQICLYSIELEETWPLTSPPGVSSGDHYPVFSPDGRVIAYWASRGAGEIGLFLQPLTAEMRPEGEPRPVGPAHIGRALWSRDGQNLYFMGVSPQGEQGLWSAGVSALAPPRLVRPVRGRNPTQWEGPSGDLRIVYEEQTDNSEIVVLDLSDPSPENVKVLLPTNAVDLVPQFSPDGSRIAFMSDRTGAHGIWLCESDGSRPELLIEMGPWSVYSKPSWSPGGRRIAVDGFGGPRNVHIVDVATRRAGPQLTTDGGRLPAWSGDGRSLYYSSEHEGKQAIWKLDIETETHTKLIEGAGAHLPAESADRRHLYFVQAGDLMRVALHGDAVAGVPETIAAEVETFGVVKVGVYYTTRSGALVRYDEESGESVQVTTLSPRRGQWSLSVSPDERWLVYSRYVSRGSDLMMLESSGSAE